MVKKAKKKISKKEKDIEVFDIENKKNNLEKQVITKKPVEELHSNKKEIKRQEKQLRTILIVLGVLVLFFVAILVGLKMIRNSSYGNTNFQTIQEGQLIFYQTSIPFLYQGKIVPYNFYLRTKPRDLKKISFEGNLELKKGYVLNVSEDFNCNGDGIIALANLVKQQEIMGIVLIKDSASCDEINRYNYYEIKSGEETRIVQRGNQSCYDIYVSNCEILKATEKLMAENFVEFNK